MMKALSKISWSSISAVTIFLIAVLIGFTQATSSHGQAAPDDGVNQARSSGFVNLASGRSIFVDYIQPAPGRPVAILLNGLTYRVGIWDPFVRGLVGDGLGVLRYDMFGQGRTLLKYAPILKPIALQDQVNDLADLIRALRIDQPVHLIALSYGGAVGVGFAAQFPSAVESLVLMAPFVAAVPSQDQIIRLEIVQTRIMNPLNPATDDQLYDFFLRQLVYATYPAAEPIVLENPYKLEATFRLVQGVRKFKAVTLAHHMPEGRVHLVQAGSDQYIPSSEHENFWNALPDGARASRIVIQGSEHKIPEAVPRFSSDWVPLIIDGDPRLTGGRSYDGSPTRHQATDGSTVIEHLGD